MGICVAGVTCLVIFSIDRLSSSDEGFVVEFILSFFFLFLFASLVTSKIPFFECCHAGGLSL